MKPCLKMVVFLSIIMVVSPGIAKETTFSKQELNEDLEMLWETVMEHPKVYEFTSESTFRTLLQSIKSQLKDGMTADDFLRIAHPLPVSLGCNHSILWPTIADLNEPKGLTLPLTMTFQEEGAFVLATYPAEQIPLGSKVESINGIPMEEIEKLLFSYFPADGLKNLAIKRARTGTMLALIYPKLVEDTEDFLISYSAPESGQSSSVSLKAFDKKTIWDAEKEAQSRNPFTVEYRAEAKTAIVRIKSFYFGGELDPFTNFLGVVFNKIKIEEIENLVLDLRDNSGGDPILAARLFAYIAPRPVVYFEVCDGYETLKSPVELKENNFSGNIYTIINGAGFSTAGHIVSLIKYHKIGTTIGSELGCTYTCNDSAVNVVLEHTGNLARIARATYAVAVKDMKADQGVQPDHQVDFSVDDLINGVDSEMEFTFDLIRQAK
ncbi:MAG: hypothetical protein GY780_03010 [bacterium]|nr:hypothetical protein [bacterium]